MFFFPLPLPPPSPPPQIISFLAALTTRSGGGGPGRRHEALGEAVVGREALHQPRARLLRRLGRHRARESRGPLHEGDPGPRGAEVPVWCEKGGEGEGRVHNVLRQAVGLLTICRDEI